MNYWKDKKILVTGGAGFLGSFVVEKLITEKKVKPCDIIIPRSKTDDLRKWEICIKIVQNVDVIIHLAAKVGGIGYNQLFPGSLFFDNAIIGIQMIEAARLAGVKKFVSIGTVCAYPKFTPIPFNEENLWFGYPEETNAPYGLAKKMLLVQTQAYKKQYNFNGIFLLPVNLYGPRDNFDPESSHVIPALIRKTVTAKYNKDTSITVWGTGNPTREFLFVEDAADAIILATEKYNKDLPINIGAGYEISIKELVKIIAKQVEYDGEIILDSSKPDGQPRRCLDVSKAEYEFGFKAKTSLIEGIKKTINWYYNNIHNIKR